MLVCHVRLVLRIDNLVYKRFHYASQKNLLVLIDVAGNKLSFVLLLFIGSLFHVEFAVVCHLRLRLLPGDSSMGLHLLNIESGSTSACLRKCTSIEYIHIHSYTYVRIYMQTKICIQTYIRFWQDTDPPQVGNQLARPLPPPSSPTLFNLFRLTV